MNKNINSEIFKDGISNVYAASKKYTDNSLADIDEALVMITKLPDEDVSNEDVSKYVSTLSTSDKGKKIKLSDLNIEEGEYEKVVIKKYAESSKDTTYTIELNSFPDSVLTVNNNKDVHTVAFYSSSVGTPKSWNLCWNPQKVTEEDRTYYTVEKYDGDKHSETYKDFPYDDTQIYIVGSYQYNFEGEPVNYWAALTNNINGNRFDFALLPKQVPQLDENGEQLYNEDGEPVAHDIGLAEAIYIFSEGTTAGTSQAFYGKEFIEESTITPVTSAMLFWNFIKIVNVRNKFADKWVEKLGTLGSGNTSVILNSGLSANGSCSISAGYQTEASGRDSVALGDHTKTVSDCQVALGRYNTGAKNKLVTVGFGSEGKPKDVLTVNTDGQVECGKVTSAADVISTKTTSDGTKTYSLNDVGTKIEEIYYGNKAVIYQEIPFQEESSPFSFVEDSTGIGYTKIENFQLSSDSGENFIQRPGQYTVKVQTAEHIVTFNVSKEDIEQSNIISKVFTDEEGNPAAIREIKYNQSTNKISIYCVPYNDTPAPIGNCYGRFEGLQYIAPEFEKIHLASPAGGTYGGRIDFGDIDDTTDKGYCYIEETNDDDLTIHADGALNLSGARLNIYSSVNVKDNYDVCFDVNNGDVVSIHGNFDETKNEPFALVVGGADGEGRISCVSTPEDPMDAANKWYVDTQKIPYNDLKSLADNGQLSPGKQYRITNYECTVANDDEAQAVSHPFDIIVTADDEYTLNENARACLHNEDDTYYSNVNLSAWELKYCLDNDTNRFAWADEVNGKGVIYWLKDDLGNECPYDFKQIQFKRYEITECEKSPDLEGKLAAKEHSNDITINGYRFIWCYTFNWLATDGTVEDLSVKQCSHISDDVFQHCYDNKIQVYSENGNNLYKIFLNNISIICTEEFDGGTHYSVFSNTFSTNCRNNTFGNSCHSNTFGNGCRSNTFGNNCLYNTFGNDCYRNTFGNSCHSNTFGNNCTNNTFGNYCYNNTFGNHYTVNTFGNNCQTNTFGNYCSYTTFGNECSSNTFGNRCDSNTFGAVVVDGYMTSKSPKDYYRYNIFDDGVSYTALDAPTSDSSYCQNYHVLSGFNNIAYTPTYVTVSEDVTTNNAYCTYIGRKTGDTESIVMFNPADLANALVSTVSAPLMTNYSSNSSNEEENGEEFSDTENVEETQSEN